MPKDVIINFFPNLKSTGFEITSSITLDYNCIAWAIKDNRKWWWPDPYYQYYWPLDIPREPNLENFIQLFKNQGYTISSNEKFKQGYEKVAIFTNQMNEPTHAARQIDKKGWTSKLGPQEDITHYNLYDIEGKEYGKVAVILEK